jgi:hypothetical protein
MDEANQLIALENPTPEQMEKVLQIAEEALALYPEWNPALFVGASAACALGSRGKAKHYIGMMDAPPAVDALRERCKALGLEL